MHCPKDPVCLSLLHQRDTTEVSFVVRLYSVPFSATCGADLWDPSFKNCWNCLAQTIFALSMTCKYLIQILLSYIIDRHLVRCTAIKSLFLIHTHTHTHTHRACSYSLRNICNPRVISCTSNSDTSWANALVLVKGLVEKVREGAEEGRNRPRGLLTQFFIRQVLYRVIWSGNGGHD
jgi:hypothetical protein